MPCTLSPSSSNKLQDIVITGGDLKPIAELERAVWQPEATLERMEPFVKDMHTKNGLLDRVKKELLRPARQAAG